MQHRRLFAALAAVLLAGADPALFDPVTGYRITAYRAVVPATPDGVRRVTAAEAAALWEGRAAVFLDVMPAEGGVRDPATGRWRLAEPRRSIPGAAWYPEAGRGAPEPEVLAWFLAGVERLTGGDRRRTVVVFCLADCWMSWNAALRLARLGYRDVRWLADGTDGWRDLGRPLVEVGPAQP